MRSAIASAMESAEWWRRYRDYLKSPQWQAKRRIALSAAKHRCQECGVQQLGLHVHHLSYKRLGRERLSDLQVLCKECHTQKHPRTMRRKRKKRRAV